MIRDDRTSKRKPYGYVIATDHFMSGWGAAASGKSFYAIAVFSEDEAYVVMTNFKHRPDFKRVRFARSLPRVAPRDHMTLSDRGTAPRYFQPGAFADHDRRRGRSRRARRSRR